MAHSTLLTRIDRRDKNGGWHLSTKGYPRYHSGPYRGSYVHRIVMQQSLGRPLRKSEDVHHRDHDKLNFRRRNLQLIDHRKHGYISAKQRWFVEKVVLPKQKKEWMSYFAEDVSFDVSTFE